jgi:uncharacterized protein YciI
VNKEVRYLSLYVPRAGGVGAYESPAFAEDRAWMQREAQAGRLVLLGILPEKYPGAALVAWTCETLEEARRLASSSPALKAGLVELRDTLPYFPPADSG